MDKLQVALCVVILYNLGILIEAVKDASCPEACFCGANKIIYCPRRGLTRIPLRIPADSVQLILNQNMLDNTRIQRRNFSSFTNLEHLYLSECGIERIEVGAFADLTRLQWLDLSSNRIRVLEDYTFRGLTLSNLFLNSNRNLNIRRNSFAGLAVTGLYLQECSLSKLHLDVFVHLNNTLQNLWLNDNELSTIDRQFLPMFSRLVHIRLGSNPFHCNCELMWLKSFYDANAGIFETAAQPSCLGPPELRGRHFSDMTSRDFSCQSPSFRNVDAIFNGTDGMLRCTASGDPAPTLFWVQPSGQSTVYHPSKNDSLKYNEAVLNVSSALVRRRDLSGSYFCFAYNVAGNMTFTFNLSWPSVTSNKDSAAVESPTIRVVPRLHPATEPPTNQQRHNVRTTTEFDINAFLNKNKLHTPSTTPHRDPDSDYDDDSVYVSLDSDENGDKTAETDNSDVDSDDNQIVANRNNVRTKKLYSLAELIGAILGTFFATLILCIILIPLYFRRRWKNNNGTPQHSLVSKNNLQETMYLNGSGSRGPQLPPRPPGHPFTYFDTTISSMNR